jgi:signal transduction histidine kinase/ligand-binding sensor domain-containing protein
VVDAFTGKSIHAICEDLQGAMWVGTREETWVRPPGVEFAVADHAPRDVKAICPDDQGNLWLGGDTGLYVRRDTKLERIVHERIPEPTEQAGGISSAGINALLADEQGNIWVGANRGLLCIKDGQFQYRGSEIGRKQVYALLETRNGGLYVATRYGLYRSVDDGEFVKLPSEEFARCITEDREGGLWVGHFAARGLHYYRNRRTRPVLSDYRVNCLHEDPGGIMWFGSYAGLHRLRDGEITHCGIADGLPNVRVQCIARGSGDGFWIGTAKGLARWTGTELSTVNTPTELTQMNITSAFEDSTGVLWFALASRGGYALSDGELSKLQALDHGRVNWFYEDSSGHLWIGHEYGLFRRSDNQIQQVTHPAFERLNSSHFICHYAARDGSLWMGTSGGIVRYQSGNYDVFTSEDGLAADYVDRIVEDHRGNLWAGGRDGFFYIRISELDAIAGGHSPKFASHRIEHLDGVPVSSHHPKACLAADRTVWIAGRQGAIRVPPEPMLSDLVPPTVRIEQVRLDGKIVPADSAVEFLSGRHRLAIDFAAPTFARPLFAQVKYRLDGQEEDWIDAGRERVAYYTDLRPGKYAFRVTADNGHGVWNEEGSTVVITVNPRWFETFWFRATFVIGLVSLLVIAVRRYTRSVRRRSNVLRKEINERKQAEERARDYHQQLARMNRAASMGEMATSIAHEVNQPLFAIVSNAQTAKRLLDREPPDMEEVREALDDIVGDGNRAASIIDHVRSRVRKGQHRTEQLDLNQVALEAVQFVEPEIRQRGLSLRTELADDLPPINGNSIELQQVILNLIINGAQSMRDAPTGSRELLLSTSVQDYFLELAVQDRGVGVDEELADRLFEPFFTTRPDGFGMGLAINRTIIEAHGGRIWATSNDDRGATFHFSLPITEEDGQ